MTSFNDWVERFRKLEANVSAERGELALFALFLREDVPDRWDLIVSAPWAEDRRRAVNYLIEKIKSEIGAEDLTHLARIVFVDMNDAGVKNLNRAIHVEHGAVEVRDSNFFGLPIKHAFIISSKSPEVTATK
jgi:hypothetical protein